MPPILEILALVSLIAGLFFFTAGIIGLIRMPDVYHRMHTVSKSSTLGLIGLCLAACLHTPTPIVIIKSLAIVVLAFIATPVSSHMLAKAAHNDGAKHWKGIRSDRLEEDKQDNPQP